MSVSFIGLFKPLCGIIPEVEKPKNKNAVSINEKIVWTGITLFIYLVCCQIPIYGINRSTGSDPLYWMRVILASNRGTLMELGISPIVTASMICQIFAGAQIIRVDFNVKEDRLLFEQVQKILGLVMAVCEAIAYTYSGMYGDTSEIGTFKCILIIIQLTFSGFIVMLLDDMLQKGHGLGSGISLFIATNICETILWKCLSPLTITSQSGTEFEGSIVNFIHLMLTKPSMISAYKAFNRASAPNLTAVLATLLIICIVIYLQGIKLEIPLFSHRQRGQQSSYPIKLFYTSNMPVIMQSYFISNVYFISQMLHRRFKDNFIINILGQWSDAGGRSHPIGGIAYYISPPNDFGEIITDPLHVLTYIAFVLTCCGLFSRYWIEISGDSTKAVVKKFTDAQLMIKDKQTEQSMVKYMDKYIPTAATLGGISVGLLTIVADFLGAIGSGTGILLAVTIVYGYFEQLKKKGGHQRVEAF